MIFNSWKVCVMNTDGTELTAIDFGDDPTWSNDGKSIVRQSFVDFSKVRIAKVLDDDGERVIQFTGDGCQVANEFIGFFTNHPAAAKVGEDALQQMGIGQQVDRGVACVVVHRDQRRLGR